MNMMSKYDVAVEDNTYRQNTSTYEKYGKSTTTHFNYTEILFPPTSGIKIVHIDTDGDTVPYTLLSQ